MGRLLPGLVFLWVVCFFSESGRAKISLQNHQKKPIDYLIRNPQIKGLLIYHGLGTGKTYLSLGLAEKYPRKDVYVLLPRFLKSNWDIQMKAFGVTNPERFRVMSFEDAALGDSPPDFANAIVVIDEVHKLVERVRSINPRSRRKYSDLYFAIQNADRILALTGTPVFSHPTDVSYAINLVAGKTLLPYDEQRFRFEYTDIVQSKSLLRGYVTESKWVDTVAPLIALGVSSVFLPSNLVVLGFMGGSAILPILRGATPVSRDSFRELKVEKLKKIASRYISFYEVKDRDLSNYPRKIVSYEEVPYSEAQAHLFFDFADQSLNPKMLSKFLGREGDRGARYIQLNSTLIQNQLAQSHHNGREIGNFKLGNIESPKFVEVLKKIKQSWGSVAVYSNYFNRGIRPFARFLDAHGYRNQYKILDPELPVAAQSEIINAYNRGALKILLIHPEITEGISLKATDQMHILEPIANIALQEQVIGRTVRYKSHERLPKEKRRVSVYVWVSELRYGGLLALHMRRDDRIRRDHYLRKYLEVNDNIWAGGIKDVDRNYQRKEKSPDELTVENMGYLARDIDAFRSLARAHSLEKM